MRNRSAAAPLRVLNASEVEREWGARLCSEAQRQARARGFRGMNWYEVRPPLEAAFQSQNLDRLPLPGEAEQALQVTTAGGAMLLYCSEQTYISRLERAADAFCRACMSDGPPCPGLTRRELAAELWQQAAVYYGAAEGWERHEELAGQLAAVACACADSAGCQFDPLDVLAMMRDLAVHPPAGAGAAVATVCTAIGRSNAISCQRDGFDPHFALHAPPTHAFLSRMAASWEACGALRRGGKGPHPPLVSPSAARTAAAQPQAEAAGDAAAALAEAAAAMVRGRDGREPLIGSAAALLMAVVPREHAAVPQLPALLEGGAQLALLAAALAQGAGDSQESTVPALLQELFTALAACGDRGPLRCSTACALLARSSIDGGGRADWTAQQVRAWLEQAAAHADRLGREIVPYSNMELQQACSALDAAAGALPVGAAEHVSVAQLQEQGRQLFLHEQPPRRLADGSGLYLRSQSHDAQLAAASAELLQACGGLSAAAAPGELWDRCMRLCVQLGRACSPAQPPAEDFAAAVALPMAAAAACLASASAARADAAPAALLALMRGLMQEGHGSGSLQLLLRLGTDCGLDEALAAPEAAARYYEAMAEACTRFAALSADPASAQLSVSQSAAPLPTRAEGALPRLTEEQEAAAQEVARLWEDGAGQRPSHAFSTACGALLWQTLTAEHSRLCPCLDEEFMELLRQMAQPWLAACLAAAGTDADGSRRRHQLAGLALRRCREAVREADNGRKPALGGAAALLRLVQGWQEVHGGQLLLAGEMAALCSRVRQALVQSGQADGAMTGDDVDGLLAALLPRCLGATAEQAAMLSCGDQLLAMAPAGRCRQLRDVDECDGAELIWCNRGACGADQRRLIITDAGCLAFEYGADGMPNPAYGRCLSRGGSGFCCAVDGAPAQLLGGLLAAGHDTPLACQYLCALRALVRRCREDECLTVLSEFEFPVLLGVTAAAVRRR